MTILDCCINLKMIKKILVVLGVVDMRQLLLKGFFHLVSLFVFALFLQIFCIRHLGGVHIRANLISSNLTCNPFAFSR